MPARNPGGVPVKASTKTPQTAKKQVASTNPPNPTPTFKVPSASPTPTPSAKGPSARTPSPTKGAKKGL